MEMQADRITEENEPGEPSLEGGDDGVQEPLEIAEANPDSGKKKRGASSWEKMKASYAQRRRAALRTLEYQRVKRIRRKKVPSYTYCKNCGEKLMGMYCHRCGQYALDIHQPFWKYIKQYFENVYQFDSKVWQTLWLLFRRPGFLTKEFNAGKINSYVHPLRLYMFLSVLFFLFAWTLMPEDTEVAGFANADSGAGSMQVQMFYDKMLGWFSSWLPLVMLLFLPVFAFFLKGFFRKERMSYMNHFVFALHIHCVWIILTFLCLLLTVVLFPALQAYWGWIAVLAGLFYLIASEHSVYQRSGWLKSLFKGLLLFCIYSVVVGLCLSVLLVWRLKELSGILG